MVILNERKRETREGKEMSNHENNPIQGEKENNTFLKILDADTLNQREIKERNKVYFRKKRTFLDIQFFGRNLIEEINAYAVSRVI